MGGLGSRNEGQASRDSGEVPLRVHWSVRFEEYKYESVAEAAEKRKAKDDRLADEHLKWPVPDRQDLFHRDLLSTHLIGTVDVVYAGFTSAFRLSVEHDRGPGLGNEEKVNDLGSGTE